MAIGKCHDETDIEAERVVVRIGGTEMYPVPAGDDALAAAAAHMKGDRVVIGADLGIGAGSFVVYGCDLTDGYVRINADYTT
jgi:glutamate N-acetyltransferase/amino-acid N-acetyltransferase